MTTLTQHQHSAIVAALRVAAEQYDRDRLTMLNANPPQYGLAQQFSNQSSDAGALADLLEDSDGLTLQR